MFDAWESVGVHYAHDNRIIIAEMDCGPQRNKKVCKKFGVDRYPMIFMFKDGVRGDLYDLEREKQDFIDYIENNLAKGVVERDETEI